MVLVEAIANKNIDTVIFGLHVNSQDGSEITAFNNRMINHDDLKNINKGSKFRFKWRIQNIFNDGTYYITTTFVSDSGIAYDWFIDSAKFKVSRQERSTTSVIPPVTLNIEK